MKKGILFLVFQLFILLSCEKSQNLTVDNNYQFYEKSEISEIGKITGIENLFVESSKGNNFLRELDVVVNSAIPVEINGYFVNLQKQKFKLKKGVNINEISSYFQDDYYRLVQYKNEIKLFKNGENVVIDSDFKFLKSLNSQDQVRLFTLFAIFEDRANLSLNRVQKSKLRQAGIYYRYTIGWGYTLATSQHDADAGNEAHEGDYQRQNCQKIGRNHSCVWGEHICITTDTWMCHD